MIVGLYCVVCVPVLLLNEKREHRRDWNNLTFQQLSFLLDIRYVLKHSFLFSLIILTIAKSAGSPSRMFGGELLDGQQGTGLPRNNRTSG